MKKVIQLVKASNPWSDYGNGSMINRVLVGHTQRTLTSSSTTSKDEATTSLFGRLAPIGDPKISVVPILDQWVEDGGKIDPQSLHRIVSRFRTSKRFHHSLQIVQWMSDKKVVDPSPTDVSVQLDLISKVHGVEQAEVYFDSVPSTLRVWQVYTSLLNCYVKAKMLEKAEDTMQKMRELGYARSLSYNIMLTLYSQLGNHEKLDLLVQEMEEKGIECNNYTCNIRLSAYGASSDLEKMETLLRKMEADPLVTMEWNSYVSAANAYLKAGAIEKAFAALKKSENLVRKNKRIAYEIILTLYANIGKRDEVYHIWNLIKKSGKFYNATYGVMINSLCKLGDLDGAERILEEWEAGLKYFDYRLPNSLITACCKKGRMEKAELIVKRLIDSGKEVNASTWSRMAIGYHKDNQMDKVVDATKKEILASEPTRKPHISTLASCLEYLKEKGDTGSIEEVMKSLQKKGLFTAYESMVKYTKQENQRSNASSEIGGDGPSLEAN